MSILAKVQAIARDNCLRCGKSFAEHLKNFPKCPEEKFVIEHIEDSVNHPAHYTSSAAVCSTCKHPIECIDVVRHLAFNVGNAIKYLWRAGLKGDELEDLRKARWYIDDRIKQLEAGE